MKHIFFFLFFLLFTTAIQSQEVNLDEAVELAKEKKFEEAIVILDSLIEDNPLLSSLYFEKANCYIEMGDAQGALNTLSSGIKSMPDSASFYDYRAVLFQEMRMYDNALKDFDFAIALTKDPELKAHLYSNAGGTKFLIRDFEGAYEYLTKALKYDPANIDALNNLAVISDEIGKPEETLGYLEKIIKVDSNYLPAYVNLGFKYQLMGNHKKAIQYFDKCVELSPEEPLAFSNRAFSKLKTNDAVGALLDINKSIKIFPTNSWAYKIRGLIYIEKGDKITACDNFQVALQLGYIENYGEEVTELIEKHCTKNSKN